MELFLIALMIVYVTDISGFPQSMLGVLWRYAYRNRPIPYDLSWSRIHPLFKICECSQCQTWWITLIVTIACGWWSVPMMAYCMLLSFLTPVFKDALVVIRDLMGQLIEVVAAYFGL